MKPPQDYLSCMINAVKGQVKTRREIGIEGSLQEIPELLKQLTDVQNKKGKKLQSSGNFKIIFHFNIFY